MLSYQISYDDKIMATSAEWDRVAVEQSGTAVLTRNILGASIWSMIRDDETRRYLNALFFISRRGQTSLTVPYRCDTPDEARLFEMIIEPLAGSALRISHRQVFDLVVDQAILPFMAIKARPDQCSQCLRIELKGDWVEGSSLQQVGVSYQHWTVCPTCRLAVTGLAHGSTARWALYGNVAHAENVLLKGLPAAAGECSASHLPEMAD